MGKKLVVVESPAKANTIGRYLGPDFEVLASYGHVRDLRPKEGAVDPERGFAMHYEAIEKNVKRVDAIARAMRKADALYLATDLDREGEAIAWHLMELLSERGLLEGKPVYRIVFHEITERAIREALEHPREIAAELVNAQQARRALDYLVGFNLSPLLWRKIRQGLSAGRVQSPALRMICEREEEIERFVPREYWTIEAELTAGQPFRARLTRLAGEKVGQFSITDEAAASRASETLRQAAATEGVTVRSVERRQRRRNPPPPFITSTLQQEAVRKLGFSARKAMSVAQTLYEGVSLGAETVGLITYMRTDSVSLAREAVAEIRGYIGERWGEEQLPARPRAFTTRSKNAQEAHEAIRPTSVRRTPESLKAHLDRDQLRLYELIWKRAVACQMRHATIDTVTVDIACGEGNVLRATGSRVAHPGFMAVYQEGRDDASGADEGNAELPALAEGQRLELMAVHPEQHFTEPPPRYNEATLVKTLEEYGIGRPSTYASIIATLLSRGYVELDKRRFRPTDMGRVVNQFLTGHFAPYVDYEFTARLEDELDAISRGEEDWVPVLERFWRPFAELVDEKARTVTRQQATQARELGTDPASGRPVTVRMGRYGPFVQIGSAEDDEKPKFYRLRPGQRIDTLTLEEALELTRLPRELGTTPEGEPVSVNIGRYGPYVRIGDRFVSLPKDEDPYTIGLERALEIAAAHAEQQARRVIREFPEAGIRVLRGRYGPYVTDGSRNARVPKDEDPEAVDLARARALLAEARPARRRRRTSSQTG